MLTQPSGTSNPFMEWSAGDTVYSTDEMNAQPASDPEAFFAFTAILTSETEDIASRCPGGLQRGELAAAPSTPPSTPNEEKRLFRYRKDPWIFVRTFTPS